MPDPLMGVMAGGSIISGFLSSKSQKSAAKAQVAGNIQAAQLQAESQRDAIEEQRRQYDISRGDLLEEREYQRAGALPYREAGQESLGQLRGLFSGDVDPTAAIEATPGYQFQVEQGRKSLESSAAARGGLLSGRALQESQQIGQGLAQGGYRNYLSDLFKMAGYGPQVAGAGQGMTSQMGILGQETSGNIAGYLSKGGLVQANLAAQSGQARASAYAANPWGNAFNSFANAASIRLGEQSYLPPDNF